MAFQCIRGRHKAYSVDYEWKVNAQKYINSEQREKCKCLMKNKDSLRNANTWKDTHTKSFVSSPLVHRIKYIFPRIVLVSHLFSIWQISLEFNGEISLSFVIQCTKKRNIATNYSFWNCLLLLLTFDSSEIHSINNFLPRNRKIRSKNPMEWTVCMHIITSINVESILSMQS